MSDCAHDPEVTEAIRTQAAAWVLRCDRGLTPEEQDEFSHWLAIDPRHGSELARHRRHWKRLNALADWRPEHGSRPNPDLLAPTWGRRIVRRLPLVTGLAAAAALALVAWYRTVAPGPESEPVLPAVAAASDDQLTLVDGSVIQMNGEASVAVSYSATERRVRLDRGEAHFSVAREVQRPFIVTARGVDVVAVGTAFNVRVAAEAVEVLVTEGKVRVDAAAGSGKVLPGRVAAPVLVPLLEARQRVVLPVETSPKPVLVTTLTSGEVQHALSWQHRLLEFEDASLSEIVAAFNRRNRVQMVVDDPELARLRISVSFRSDNIDGFLRLLEAGFGAEIDWITDQEIQLRGIR